VYARVLTVHGRDVSALAAAAAAAALYVGFTHVRADSRRARRSLRLGWQEQHVGQSGQRQLLLILQVC
jgi:S-adenosylmethionine hydrolase